jgi:hypothetical protein
MIWRKATERSIGGNYTWYDSAVTPEELLPLLYCIGCSFPARDRDTYWYYVPAVFENSRGEAGGDPGWHIERYTDDAGKIMYGVRQDTYIDEDPELTGDYDEATVKYYFAKTMREYARHHPDATPQIEELIRKYELEPGEHAESGVSPVYVPQAPARQGLLAKITQWLKGNDQ